MGGEGGGFASTDGLFATGMLASEASVPHLPFRALWSICGSMWGRKNREAELLTKLLDLEFKRIERSAVLDEKRLELDAQTIEIRGKEARENAEARERLREIRRQNAARRPRDDMGRLRATGVHTCRVCTTPQSLDLSANEILYHNAGHTMGN